MIGKAKRILNSLDEKSKIPLKSTEYFKNF